METINDRLEQLINSQFDGNKAAFAKSIDLPPTGLSNYLGQKRRSKPPVDMITKIITRLHVDPIWLLTGEEPKPAEPQTPAPATPKTAPAPPSSPPMPAPLTTTADNLQSYAASDRVAYLEALLAEKERLISVLMQTNQTLQNVLHSNPDLTATPSKSPD